MLTGLCRNTIDKFYTKEAVAESLIHKITTYINIDYQNDSLDEIVRKIGESIEQIEN